LSGRGLCDELITRPEESYRLWCVVVYDLETSRIGAPYIYDISNLRVKHYSLIAIKRFFTTSIYVHPLLLPLVFYNSFKYFISQKKNYSVQFNSCLLMCRVNSQMAHYRNRISYKHK